jgi:hypothetical protein
MISRKDVNHGQTEEHETFVSLGFGAENYYDQPLDRDGEHRRLCLRRNCKEFRGCTLRPRACTGRWPHDGTEHDNTIPEPMRTPRGLPCQNLSTNVTISTRNTKVEKAHAILTPNSSQIQTPVRDQLVETVERSRAGRKHGYYSRRF